MNVQRLSRTGVILGAVFTAVTASGQTGQKIAYVNTQTIVARAPGTAAAEETLRKEGEALQLRVKVWQDSLQAMIDNFRKSEASMTASMKESRTKAIEDRRQDYAKRADSLDNLMQQRQAELSQPIMAQIRETLDQIKSEDGYSFIFDVSASGVIVAADKNLDLTDKVIGRLRPIPVTAKLDSAKAAGAKAPVGVKKPPTE
jgi:outer membrane protein